MTEIEGISGVVPVKIIANMCSQQKPKVRRMFIQSRCKVANFVDSRKGTEPRDMVCSVYR